MNKNKAVIGNDDLNIPTRKLHFNKKTGEMTEWTKSEAFLKGPIPMSWINRVASLPGKVLNVALAIRWLSDMNANQPIKLTRNAMERFNFSSDAASAALKLMEKNGLIKIQRLRGQKPWIEAMPMNGESSIYTKKMTSTLKSLDSNNREII